MIRWYTGPRLAGFFIVGSLLLGTIAHADNEQPASMNAQDKGVDLPVSLVKGSVSSQSTRYILGPGDKIAIRIRDLDQFNQTVTIRPDGYATIHPFGERRLAGTDVQGMQTLLEAAFKLYLLKPQISVDVTEMRPALIYISGAVQKPGTYQFTRSAGDTSTSSGPLQERVALTLTHVLGKTGGLKRNADMSAIQVIHAITGEKETFDLKAFLSGVENLRDVLLMSEDRIVVPEAAQIMGPDTFKLISNSTYFRENSQERFPVLVLGAVQRQGEIQIDPGQNNLNNAIVQAGGFIAGLSKRDAVILQRPTAPGHFNRWVVRRNQTNLALMPGDILYVPDSKVAGMERGLRFLGSISQPCYFGLPGTNVIQNQIFQSPIP